MPNTEQIEYWNGKVGDTWVQMQEHLDRAFTPVTVALLSAAAPRPGEDVLDVGCGTGETTLALASAVGVEGTVLGLDISGQLLTRARERAEELLIDAEFLGADAASYGDDGGFDLIVSRFGVMFFSDPVAAFAHLHSLAATGGRLCFACWQAPSENLWATMPLRALADLLPEISDVDTSAPGPFAFADPERVQSILATAGWQDIAFDDLPFSMIIGEGDESLAAAVRFNMHIGPAARALSDASPAIKAVASDILAKALVPFNSDDKVSFPCAVWLVSARA